MNQIDFSFFSYLHSHYHCSSYVQHPNKRKLYTNIDLMIEPVKNNMLPVRYIISGTENRPQCEHRIKSTSIDRPVDQEVTVQIPQLVGHALDGDRFLKTT